MSRKKDKGYKSQKVVANKSGCNYRSEKRHVSVSQSKELYSESGGQDVRFLLVLVRESGSVQGIRQ